MNNVNQIIADKLNGYGITNQDEWLHAIREITQEIALASLAQTDFFDVGVFHGGTSLRILHGMERYSEDLDFSLVKPDNAFQWQPYLQKMQSIFASLGCALEIEDRSKLDSTVKKAFVKESSIGQMLNFFWIRRSATPQKVRIKLEIDSNPPAGAKLIDKTLDFPVIHTVKTQTLQSQFATKCHALLCREYIKGRDWFDFMWYNSKNIEPNYTLLSNALHQVGPWKDTTNKINRTWLESALADKICTLDMNIIKQDVSKFVDDATSLKVQAWSKDTFLAAVDTFHKNCIKRDREKVRDDRGR